MERLDRVHHPVDGGRTSQQEHRRLAPLQLGPICLMVSSLMPTSASLPPSAPLAAPTASPATAIRKIIPSQRKRTRPDRSRPLRASACSLQVSLPLQGRPCGRQRHDGHPGTGLTLHTSRYSATPGSPHRSSKASQSPLASRAQGAAVASRSACSMRLPRLGPLRLSLGRAAAGYAPATRRRCRRPSIGRCW
jgi:hypothetical protein